MRKVVARFNFPCTLTGNRPQTLTGFTAKRYEQFIAPEPLNNKTMNTKIVLEFVDAINEGDIDEICKLMSDDHLFIDSQDCRVAGKNTMKLGWIEYFKLFPDYKIDIEDIFEKSELVCLLGYASGTYRNLQNETKSNHWRIPAAWKAIVYKGQIKQWQVYADNIIVMDIINSNKQKKGDSHE
jgi:ketosteroid isomerase-like protein